MTDALHALTLSPLAQHSYWILLFPLLSFIINGIWIHRYNRHMAAGVSIVFSAASMAWAVALVQQWLSATHGVHGAVEPIIPWNFRWLPMLGALQVKIGLLLDPISAMMLVVVSVIAFLVHLYSVGYMREDKASGRFFALLSLFAFAMLGLVMATNLIQMYVFWELVGVSSYTLIGFWYHKPSAVAASKKAFIVTRFADAFFLLGIVIVAFIQGNIDFLTVNTPEAAAALNRDVSLGLFSLNALSLATLLIFTGGWGKSAMFPLHVWLPDAMEGPTPVSSIIHSATMVVAGVYLTARMFPLFSAAPYTLEVVAVVGAFTALFAAIIAITQKDIKRILAFSTLSQLGYMMFALGVSRISVEGTLLPMATGFSASMFHVFTHAFFKCMLFLGAGAVIHVVHSNDLDVMGGLRKKMPLTYTSLLIATLSISGIFPFAGFFSKDEILLAAWQSGNLPVFAVGLAVGGLTAFYMFRFFFLIFHGQPRLQHQSDHHHHREDPWMTLPIVLLTIPTLLAGVGLHHVFAHLMVPPVALAQVELHHPHWLPYVASAMGLGGLLLAWWFYGRSKVNMAAILDTDHRSRWYQVIYDKFYIDEIWLFISRKVIINGFSAGLKWADRHLVDGFMDLVGWTLHLGGRAIRSVQTGSLPLYLGVFVSGFFLIYWFGNLPLQ